MSMRVPPKPCSMNAAVAPLRIAWRLASLRGRPALAAGAAPGAIDCLLDHFDTYRYRFKPPAAPPGRGETYAAARRLLRGGGRRPERAAETPMSYVDTEELRRCIQPGRVHRRVYTDPAIFDLEMERIFGRAWIYIGHESQVKNPGDYWQARIGQKPVVMTRHTDGKIY